MDATQTINQLGGNRIFAMAFEAKRSVIAPTELRLRIAAGLTRSVGATHVIIAIDGDDTYTVSLVKVRKFECTTTKSMEMVYGDQLRATVESMTGLRMGL